MEKLRQALLDKNVNTFKQMQRKFRVMDDDRSRTLDFEELAKGIRELGLTDSDMTEEEILAVFSTLDKDGSKSLNIDEFLEAVTPPMSEARKEIVKKAFQKADKTGDGKLTTADLKGVHNVTYNPDFKNGKKTEEELLTEFLNSFEPDEASRDGVVTLEEFEKYYAGVGKSYDADEAFIQMVKASYCLE
ncbi:calcyphosin-like protein [Acanthaster planci]|uniref:Calcyphosin-like protein n=1 Tax=Acanthaster planci TaxID=133434 RepID=A0A8B7Z7I9_ACAPL|nr:calcyphosin-like protein [Acanthaster planci]